MPVVVVTPARSAPPPPRSANPPPTPRSTIVPRGIPSTHKAPSARVVPAPARITSTASAQRPPRNIVAAASVETSPRAPSTTGTETAPATESATGNAVTVPIPPPTPPPPQTALPDTIGATHAHSRDTAPRQATLGALVIHADWSEACSEFVPRALATLAAHPALTGGALAVHVDAEPCLCARYAVKGIPCVIFRARPLGPSWRLRGVARPFEIPRTRITGVCSESALAAHIDAAVATFCRVVPPAVDPAAAATGATAAPAGGVTGD